MSQNMTNQKFIKPKRLPDAVRQTRTRDGEVIVKDWSLITGCFRNEENWRGTRNTKIENDEQEYEARKKMHFSEPRKEIELAKKGIPVSECWKITKEAFEGNPKFAQAGMERAIECLEDRPWFFLDTEGKG